MSTTRRTILQGLAALPVAAVPAGAAAALGASPADDQGLAELAQTYARTWDRLQTTMAAFNAAVDRLVRPAIPEALFVGDGDLISASVQSKRGGRWCYDRKPSIEAMRGWRPEWSAKPVWVSSWERRDEIVAAFDAWQVAIKAAEDAAGFTTANAEYEAAMAADDAVRLRVINYQSTDPACLCLKLRAFMDSVGPGDLAEGIAAGVEQHGPSEDEIALSIVRDLCALHGVTA